MFLDVIVVRSFTMRPTKDGALLRGGEGGSTRQEDDRFAMQSANLIIANYPLFEEGIQDHGGAFIHIFV